MATAFGLVGEVGQVRHVGPAKALKPNTERPTPNPTLRVWDADFNEKTVGQVNIGDDNTDIRINRHHPLIDKALSDNPSTGCGCRTAGSREGPTSLLALLVLGSALRLRRKER